MMTCLLSPNNNSNTKKQGGKQMNFKKTAAIVAAAGALTALALPALAETGFYGSARLATFYNAVDNTLAANATTGVMPPSKDTTNIDEHLQTNSVFGMNASSGDLTGKVELGLGAAGVTTRLLYGSYKYGFGKVLVGQDYNNYYVGSASVVLDDNAHKSYGALWDTRQPQLKVTLNNGLYIAFIQPTATVGSGLSTKILMPKTNVGYEGKVGAFAFGTGVVGQKYQETYVASTATAAQITDGVTSVLGYIHGTLGIGAAEIKFNLGYGRNTGNMGFTNANATATNKLVRIAATATAAAQNKNTNTLEGFVQAKYTVSPTLAINTGIGYVSDTNDTFQTAATATAAAVGKKADNRLMAYANVPVGLGKGFTVIPEVAFVNQLDEKNSNVKGTKTLYAGAKWQMDF
jgi:hypothetical protein